MARGVFSADWSPSQELKLLKGLEEFGYGNWSSISLRTNKSPEDCKEHYDHYYLDRHYRNIPGLSLSQLTSSSLTSSSLGGVGKLRSPGFARGGDDREEPSPVYYPGTEIAGYMPHRGDFAWEPDDHAEAIIANLEEDPEKDELTTALNLAAISIYQSRLKRREYRKRIVKNYGLLDILRQTAVDASRLTPPQLQFKNTSRPFIRFMSPTNAAKFLQSHFLEEQLCCEIRRLQKYRNNGITTYKGVKLYERLLSDRNHRKATLKHSSKNYSAEENLLYQVLHQGPFKGLSRKPVPREPKRLDVTYCSGVEKLDKEERELCSVCRLQPEAYLQCKRQLLAECSRLGKLTLADSRKLLKIDVNKTRKVYDLLIAKGLVHATSPTSTPAPPP